jgi:hypothetical protein
MPHLESLEDRSLLTGSLGGYSYTTFQFPGGVNTTPSGISDFGQVVGSYNAVSGQTDTLDGFLLSGGIYTRLDFPGAAETLANGINASGGEVVGYYSDSRDDINGFVLFKGAYTTLSFPGGTQTIPIGVNDSGQVVGEYKDTSGTEQGFLLSGGNYTTLHFAGTTSTIPMGINNSGQIVGAYGIVSQLGFLLSAGIYTSYPTFLTGINDSGQIIGVFPNVNGFEQGFLLSGGNYLMLDIPGAIQSYAAGINDSGQIVGNSGNDINVFDSFLGSPETLAATTTTIRSGPSPSNYGQTVTFSAQVVNSSPNSTAEPTGSVQFFVDGKNYGAPVPLNAQGAALMTDDSLSAGTHQITAGFLPDDNKFSGSFSGTAATQVVNAAVSQIKLSASGLVYNRSTQLFGGTITLTNTGTTTIGVLEVELTGLPSGVILDNASGTAADGNPYLLVNSPDGILLAPGQSITLTVLFANPKRLLFQYGIMVLGPNS